MRFAASLRIAGGRQSSLSDATGKASPARQAWEWFLSSYPLIGAVAAQFRLREDILACQQYDVSVAMIDISGKEVFFNPASGLTLAESKFVIAHEILHALLRHDVRQDERDPLYFNYAYDFAINLWLRDMDIGTFPEIGGLYDERFRGWSAESIYDHIVQNRRLYRRLRTFRGAEQRDFLGVGERTTPEIGLDEIIRNSLRVGIDLHRVQVAACFLPG